MFAGNEVQYSTLALRGRWLLRVLGRHPLSRTSDRLEAFLVLAVLVMPLLAIPGALWTRDVIFEARLPAAEHQVLTRHAVQAVAITDSAAASVRDSRPGAVTVRWYEAWQERTTTTHSPVKIKKGAPVTVWLDDTGHVTDAPETPQHARSIANGRAVLAWAAVVVATAASAYGVRWRLDQVRARSWAHAWRDVARRDDGWANRHD